MIFKDKYLQDYKVKKVKGADGKTVDEVYYAGPLYDYPYDDKAKLRWQQMYFRLNLMLVACWIAALAINVAETSYAFIVIPLACCILPLYYFTLSVMRFVFNKPPLKREQHDKIEKRSKKALIAVAVCYAVAFIALIVYYATEMESFTGMSFAFFLLIAVPLIMSGLGIYRISALKSFEIDPKKSAGTSDGHDEADDSGVMDDDAGKSAE